MTLLIYRLLISVPLDTQAESLYPGLALYPEIRDPFWQEIQGGDIFSGRNAWRHIQNVCPRVVLKSSGTTLLFHILITWINTQSIPQCPFPLFSQISQKDLFPSLSLSLNSCASGTAYPLLYSLRPFILDSPRTTLLRRACGHCSLWNLRGWHLPEPIQESLVFLALGNATAAKLKNNNNNKIFFFLTCKCTINAR